MLMQGVNGTVTTFGGGGERYSDYLNRFLSGIFLFFKISSALRFIFNESWLIFHAGVQMTYIKTCSFTHY